MDTTNKRYYYKSKDETKKTLLSLKEPLVDDDLFEDFVEISEEEYNSLKPKEIDQEKMDEAKAKYNEYLVKQRKEKNAKKSELNKLLNWFKEYDKQCMEYSRHMRLDGKSDIDIVALDNQAKENAARIKELRESKESK